VARIDADKTTGLTKKENEDRNGNNSHRATDSDKKRYQVTEAAAGT
jgi:hypothetical protein